jgi:hypothetical protein
MSALSNNYGHGTSLPPPPPLSAPPSHRNSSSHQPPLPQSTHHNHNGPDLSSRRVLNDSYGESSRDLSSNSDLGRSRSPLRDSGPDSRAEWWNRTDGNKARRDPWERDRAWPHRREFSDSSNDSQQPRTHRQPIFHNHNNAESVRPPADSPSSSRNTHDRAHHDHSRPSWLSGDEPRNYPSGSPSSTSNPNTSHAPHRQPTINNHSPHSSSTSPKTRVFPPPPPPPSSYRASATRGADPPYPLDDEISRSPPSSQKWR